MPRLRNSALEKEDFCHFCLSQITLTGKHFERIKIMSSDNAESLNG
jgi:hypothetical protein